ncbi:MAG: FtsX-like permease family protein [Anaerovoracaceae bacterium]|jgi:putative ABC transport system permease protein
MWRNALGIIAKNKLNVVGIFVIVFLTAALGTCFLETNQNMILGLDQLKAQNVQDFSFFPKVEEEEIFLAEGDYQKAAEEKVNRLADKYRFQWEKREYLIFREGEKITRIYPDDRVIDEYLLVQGKQPIENQLMMDIKYAKAHDLSVGDQFSVEGEDYTISGIALLPEMLSPVVDDSGKLYDVENQGMVIVNRDTFDQLAEDEEVKAIYVGIFKGKSEKKIEQMKEDQDILSFQESKDNPQIFASVSSQQNMNKIIMGFSMGILASITILLLLITISEHIKEEYKNLGVLKALGYKNTEISRKYLLYFLIIGIPALLGYFAGHFLTPYYYDLVFGTFSIPFGQMDISGMNLIIFALIPAVAFAIVAYLWAMFNVRRPALSMVQSRTREGANRLVMWRNKGIKLPKYLRGVRNTLLLSRIMILVFVLFSGFALGVQIQFAYTTYNMTGNIKDHVLSEYRYERDVRLIETKDDEEGEERAKDLVYLSKGAQLKTEKGKTQTMELCIVGEKNTSLLALKDKQGKAIGISKTDGVIINEWMQIKYGLEKGEKITLMIDGKSYSSKVGAVSQSVYGKRIYIDKNQAKKIFDFSMDGYNGFFTENKLSYDEDKYVSVISKDEMGKSVERTSKTYVTLSIMLFVCGLVVGATILMLALSRVIQSNKQYIAFMEGMGYTKKECSYATISGYRIIAIIGFLISIPYTIMLSRIMFRMISAGSDMAYPTSINVVSIAVCLVLTMGIVELLLTYFRKQLGRTTLKEIMEG